jgi:predicted nucleic acid-binding protein
MRIYFDVSCLNRPFDDQRQARIRLESEAITLLFDEIDAGRWEQVSSRMAEIEARAISDETRRRRVLALLPEARMELERRTFDRARELIGLRLRAADAVHTAAAEHLGADVLLTCDDQLLRVGQRMADQLGVRIANPIDWLKEQFDATNAG